MQAAAPEPKKRNPVVTVVLIVGFLFGGVCLLGIVAAISIPAFIGYVRRSKTSEAHTNVRAIATAEASYCTEHGNYLFPAGPLPATAGPEKQAVDFDTDPTFHSLGVSFPDPVYYSYSVLPQGAGEIVVTAHGDLDGD